MLKILIADDEPLVRAGINLLFPGSNMALK